MGKIEKLLDKTKRNGETKKWIVYAGILFIISLLALIFIGVYTVADVDDYLQHHKDSPQLYDFYDLKIGERENAVYILGSSLIGASCYAPLINKCLTDDGFENITVYNLWMSSDTPVRRSTQIQSIIDSSPSLVVYGVTYHEISASDWRGERIILVHDRLKIREDSMNLYSDVEKKDFETIPTILWKKAYISSALKSKKQETDEVYYGTYLTDIGGRSMDKIINSTPVHVGDIIDTAIWAPKITNEMTRYKNALIYNVNTLQNAGINVVIMNMPLHPELSKQISDDSRNNMFSLLNETGAPWYDLEQMFDESFFSDSHHASSYGTKEFSPVIANIIEGAIQ